MPEELFDPILLSGKSTGPRTPEGKARSSQNARKHGCTSRKLILPGERQEDFDALLDDWLFDFQPQAATACELVAQTAQAHWLYLRVQRQCDEAEAGMDEQNPSEWSEAQWKLRERMGRYRTTAERTFHRALTAIEARRKSRMAESDRAERLQLMAQRIELQHLHRMEQQRFQEEKLKLQRAKQERRAAERRDKEAREKAARVKKAAAAKQKSSSAARKSKQQELAMRKQWVEVRVAEGATTTEYVPSNGELIEREALVLGGHAGPTGVGNLPRPHERSGSQ